MWTPIDWVRLTTKKTTSDHANCCRLLQFLTQTRSGVFLMFLLESDVTSENLKHQTAQCFSRV